MCPAAERTNWLRMHCDDLSLHVLVAQALDNAAGIDSLERVMAQWLPAFAKNLSETLPVITGYRVLRFVGCYALMFTMPTSAATYVAT